MRRILTFLLLIFFSICVITGCSQPAGSINKNGEGGGGGNGNGNGNGNGGGDGDSRTTYDFLMLRPNRILYELDGGKDGRFDRAADLRVFVADDEGYRSLDLFDPGLKLEIIMYPGLTEIVTVINSHFPFSEAGRHVIRGTYDGKTDEYSIEVRGTLVNPGDGSGFIEMEWL